MRKECAALGFSRSYIISDTGMLGATQTMQADAGFVRAREALDGGGLDRVQPAGRQGFSCAAAARVASVLLLIAGFPWALPMPAKGAVEFAESAAEREVAEWVLRQGGEVMLHGDGRHIREVSQLPATPFRIHTVNCVDIHGSVADLERLGSLADLRRLYVSSRMLIGGRARDGAGGGKGRSPWGFLARLEHLEAFGNSEPVVSFPVEIDDAALAQFGAPGNLQELRVTRTAVKGSTLGAFRNLRRLDLSYS
ncbi:MAG TPA: hypothetical protein VL523_15195, partial [Terriglobia bacterium]|nr:hypothetical protein [Terriglobia bacterium]